MMLGIDCVIDRLGERHDVVQIDVSVLGGRLGVTTQAGHIHEVALNALLSGRDGDALRGGPGLFAASTEQWEQNDKSPTQYCPRTKVRSPYPFHGSIPFKEASSS